MQVFRALLPEMAEALLPESSVLQAAVLVEVRMAGFPALFHKAGFLPAHWVQELQDGDQMVVFRLVRKALVMNR